MKIAIGSDHGGFKLKQVILEEYSKLHDFKDFGCFSEASVDYPDIAKLVSQAVLSGEYQRGILVCRSGQGMAIQANRYVGLRAAVCYDVDTAQRVRKHNDCNILALGADKSDDGISLKIVDAWLNTEFEGGRHSQRIAKLDSDTRVRGTQVSVSLLSDPFRDENTLRKFILSVEAAGADSLHWDVMDGMYNGNNTWQYQGPEMMGKLRKITNLPFSAHLMIKEPLEKIRLLNDAGCNQMTIHYESTSDISATIDEIRSCGRLVGLAIEPDTHVEDIRLYLPRVDEVLVMSVKTGYAGQNFQDITEKIKNLADIRAKDRLQFDIAVDGGINDKTGTLCRKAGADVLIAASYIQKMSYVAAIRSLRD